MANRLAEETSPYLLQHKDNPVDWYPWGPDALERARSEDKPILLSVGYAACHWCHVMEHESFENAATAALMNEHFVCVKVDREERPDIDAVYMEAVQAMTGHGGWPMTVFLTPDGKPFYGGTYFPPTTRHGLPGFADLLNAIATTWRERREEVEKQGRALVEHIAPYLHTKGSGEPSASALTEALSALQRSFDPVNGGFGGAPKFPQAAVIDLLLRLRALGHEAAGAMAIKTLDAMAAGGIFDQLGGGFHRYATDAEWVVPHFEKMLYDNAQLLRTYARAWRETKNDVYRTVVESTAAWLLDEMREVVDEDLMGFWSSLDADSDGVEGKFYVWGYDEFVQAADKNAEVAVARWGVAPEGNFEGSNILIDTGAMVDESELQEARDRLLAYRSHRTRPPTDSKIITSWNALTASALAEAGALLGRLDLVSVAGSIMGFLADRMRPEGRLMRSFRGGVVKHLAFCEDYAFYLEAALALFEATHDTRWIEEARWAADEAIRLFEDPDGGFFTTGADAEQLVTRAKDLLDGAMPSANSVMALELQRLALITGEGSYEDRAVATIGQLGAAAGRSPLGFPHLLSAIGFYTMTPREVVVIGDPSGGDTLALVETYRDATLPFSVLLVGEAGSNAGLPLMKDRARIDGKATAFVCLRGECKLPVTDPRDLTEQLRAE